VLAATAVVITTVPLGSYFLKLRNDCYTGDCSRLTTTGVSLLAAGGAALVFEIAWIIYVERASASAPAIGVLPVPGGGVASWVGRF
jgi:hypothetical protein